MARMKVILRPGKSLVLCLARDCRFDVRLFANHARVFPPAVLISLGKKSTKVLKSITVSHSRGGCF